MGLPRVNDLLATSETVGEVHVAMANGVPSPNAVCDFKNKANRVRPEPRER